MGPLCYMSLAAGMLGDGLLSDSNYLVGFGSAMLGSAKGCLTYVCAYTCTWYGDKCICLHSNIIHAVYGF